MRRNGRAPLQMMWGPDGPEWMIEQQLIDNMTSPVRCAHCGRIYDLGKVTVLQRYLDCSVWKTPCCRVMVDDRGPGWGRHDYDVIDAEGRIRWPKAS